MADINRTLKPGARVAQPDAPARPSPADRADQAALHEFAELIFFAYRDFISDPDTILGELGFGRAHHRVLHFVARYPGLRVADLLEILKITKQSLGRVLKALIDRGYVDQRAGRTDRRERLLYLTERGEALAERLQAPQRHRLTQALEAAAETIPLPEPQAREVVRRFLYCMITERERENVSQLFASRLPRLGEGEGE